MKAKSHEVSLEGFVAYIFSRPPETPLQHDKGLVGCAFGMYVRADIVDDGEELTDSDYVAYYHDLEYDETGTSAEFVFLPGFADNGPFTFVDAIDEPLVMERYCPTMGEMQTFIRLYYPKLVPADYPHNW